MRSLVWGLSLGAIGLGAGLLLTQYVGMLAGGAIAFFATGALAALLIELPIWCGAIAGLTGALFIGAAAWISGAFDLLFAATLAVACSAASCAGLFVATRRRAHIQPR